MKGPLWSRGRVFIRRLLERVLPSNDWTEEFLEELDAELLRRRHRYGGLRLTIWYLRQAVSPQTMRFIHAVRAREREREGKMGTRGSALAGSAMDLRHAFRSLARDPWATVLIVVSLGLGIGSVTAMYGVAQRLFLEGPPHVVAPEQVYHVHLRVSGAGGERTSPWIPYRTARAIQDGAGGFARVSLYRLPTGLVDYDERVRSSAIAEVDGRYFELLGAAPEAGRFFGEEPDPGVAVLSYATAVAEFGSAGAALGRSIRIDEVTRSVAGVAPPGFAGPKLDRIDVWTPLDEERATGRNWWVAGRLASGTSAAAARAEAQTIHERQDPGRSFQWARDGTIALAGLDADPSGERAVETSVARLLLVLVVLVLLIAWGNVLNLLLARITKRRAEVTVRLALGVGRWRLARLLLAESLLLSLGGGLLALPVAHGEGMLIRRVLLPDVAWGGAVLHGDVMIFAVLVALLSSALLALLPARRANRLELSKGLSTTRGSVDGGGFWIQTALATSQVTLSAALLLCAGLFLKSFWTMRVTDLGVDADQVYAVHLRSLGHQWGAGGEEEAEVYGRAFEDLRRREDGSRVAISVGLPFFANFGKSVYVDVRDSVPELPGGGPWVSLVSEGYFAAVGTRILRGSGITAEHVAGGARVAVIGAETARTLWPSDEALGRCVRVGDPSDPCFRVVGVAADVHRRGYREPPSMQLYLPLGSTSDFSGSTLLVRLPGGGNVQESRVGEELRAVDPRIDHVEIRRLDSFLEPQIRPWRLGAAMLTLAAVLAVVMSIGGVFGVLTYIVARRRREIGIRMALGASGHSIRGLVLRTGVVAGFVGVAVGFAGVLASSRWLGPLLFETRVADPGVMLGVGGGLIGVAMAACLLPARRAAAVDPVASLRAEG